MSSVNTLPRASKAALSTLNYIADPRCFTLISDRVVTVAPARDPNDDSRYLSVAILDATFALQTDATASRRQAFQVRHMHNWNSSRSLVAPIGTTATHGGEIIAASAPTEDLSGDLEELAQYAPDVHSYVAGFRPSQSLGINIFLRSGQALSNTTDYGLTANPVRTRMLFRLPDDQDKLTARALNGQRMVSTTFSRENPHGSVPDAESAFLWVWPDAPVSADGGESMFSENTATMARTFKAARETEAANTAAAQTPHPDA